MLTFRLIAVAVGVTVAAAAQGAEKLQSESELVPRLDLGDVKLEFWQGFGPRGCGCNCTRARPFAVFTAKGVAVSDKLPFTQCSTLLARLRRAAEKRTLQTTAGPVEAHLGAWRLGQHPAYDPLRRACEALLQETARCEGNVVSAWVAANALTGPLASFEETTEGAGAGGPPWFLRSWTTVDLRTGKPVPLTDLVEAEALHEALKSAPLGGFEPGALAATTTLEDVTQGLHVEGRRPKLASYALGEFDPSTRRIAVTLGLNEDSSGSPSSGEIRLIRLSLPLKPERVSELGFGPPTPAPASGQPMNIEGTVQTLYPQFLPQVQILLREEGTATDGTPAGWKQVATADKRGRFVVKKLNAQGRYQLRAAHPNGLMGSTRIDPPRAGTVSVTVPLHRPFEAGMLRVRVVGESGAPIANADVRMDGDAGKTDEKGLWRSDVLIGAPQATARVAVRWQGLVFHATASQPFPEALVVRVPDGSLVLKHASAKGSEVLLLRKDVPPEAEGAQRQGRAVADGTAFDALGEGPWQAWVVDPAGNVGQVELALAAGEKKTVDVTLSAAASIEGVLLNARTGKPVAGAVITTARIMIPTLQRRREWGSSRAITDAMGRFSLTGLSAGRRALSVEAAGYETRRFVAEAVAPPGRAPMSLRLAPEATWLSPKQQMLWPGFLARPQGTSMVVEQVYPHGPVGVLKPGDELRGVNGVSTKGLEVAELEALLDDKDPPTVELVRGGQKLKVTLPAKRRLIQAPVQ